MYNISTHTTQINGWIMLTLDLDFTSHALSDLNYVVDLIEHEMEIPGRIIKPDVLLTSSSENQSVIADCKSETITEQQSQNYKYAEGNPGTVLRATDLATDIDRPEYKVEACYSSFSDLTSNEILSSGDFTFVHFEHTTSGVFIRNPIQFADDNLSSIFPFNMDPDKNLPTEYYPFDIEHREDYQEFVSALIQSLIYNAANNSVFDVEEALRDAHPYWKHIGDEKQQRFIEEAEKIMYKLKSEDVSDYIEKIAGTDGEYIVHHRTASALQDRLSNPGFIERVSAQIDQKTLN